MVGDRTGPAQRHGILLVDKPAGVTSAGVVREVKRRLGGAKVGHLGTLDPFATGLLPLCVGEGAKIVPYLNQEDKAYEGAIRLGVETDTLDLTGRPAATAPVPVLSDSGLKEVAARFLGTIEQTPPMHSALKRGGVPLYRLAHKGIEVEREPRRVHIHSLSLEPAGLDEIAFRVECSKGTYVRVLGAEIARALGSVGHLTRLRRTAFGPFDVGRAVSPERVGTGDLPSWIGLRQALDHLPELEADASLERSIRLGQQAALARLLPPAGEVGPAKVIGAGGQLVALVAPESGVWKLQRVFADTPSLDSSRTSPLG